jgi:hypothetical protein
VIISFLTPTLCAKQAVGPSCSAGAAFSSDGLLDAILGVIHPDETEKDD